MSLKFGIYLVEQRIISPEQFCGLVKIQQEANASLATIAIRNNIMTIKQVAKVLNAVEARPSVSFIETAIAEQLIDSLDAERLIYEQQHSCPTIQSLLVECGLLTAHQTRVLFEHFEKQAARGLLADLSPSSTTTAAPERDALRSAPAPQPETPVRPEVDFVPPQPKFSRRPVVVKPLVSNPGN